MLLRQWRRKRSIVRRLVRLGVSREQARRGVYSGTRSWWALSHNPAVERALRNAYFAKRGLVSLVQAWREHHAPQVVLVPVQRELDFGSLRAATPMSEQGQTLGPTPTSRRAGCVAHKSGSVRGGGG